LKLAASCTTPVAVNIVKSMNKATHKVASGLSWNIYVSMASLVSLHSGSSKQRAERGGLW
jgi:hypothetical protein